MSPLGVWRCEEFKLAERQVIEIGNVHKLISDGRFNRKCAPFLRVIAPLGEARVGADATRGSEGIVVHR